ncbi:hypothetical protein CSX11_14930 [Mycobacterium goodii]|nr:hypothetical protein CSX11_14930 [Mycolicibacterium goodii]
MLDDSAHRKPSVGRTTSPLTVRHRNPSVGEHYVCAIGSLITLCK